MCVSVSVRERHTQYTHTLLEAPVIVVFPSKHLLLHLAAGTSSTSACACVVMFAIPEGSQTVVHRANLCVCVCVCVCARERDRGGVVSILYVKARDKKTRKDKEGREKHTQIHTYTHI